MVSNDLYGIPELDVNWDAEFYGTGTAFTGRSDLLKKDVGFGDGGSTLGTRGRLEWKGKRQR